MKSYMKVSCVFLLLLGATPSLTAQDLDDKSISFTYYSYPLNPLPEGIKNFYVDLQGLLSKDVVFPGMVRNKVAIKGLTRVDIPENANMTLKITADNIVVKQPEIKTEKASDGTTTTYYYLVTYTFPMSIVLTDADKKVIYSERLFMNEITAKSDVVNDQGALRVIYPAESSIRNIGLRNSLDLLVNHLNENFGSNNAYKQFYLFSGKGRKINYDEMDEAIKTVKSVFKSDVIKNLNASGLEQLKSVSQTWKKELATADTLNANARINAEIYHGLNFNLAFSSLWEGNFNEAWDYLQKAKGSKKYGYKENVEKLEKFLSNYQSAYLANNSEIKLEPFLIGAWKLVDAKSSSSHDLNKDGQSSVELFKKEYGDCDKNMRLEFSLQKTLNYQKGSGTSCKGMNQNLYWAIFKEKASQKRVLVWDNTEKVSPDLGTVMNIKKISGHELVISGELRLDSTSDTTDGITLYFTKE